MSDIDQKLDKRQVSAKYWYTYFLTKWVEKKRSRNNIIILLLSSSAVQGSSNVLLRFNDFGTVLSLVYTYLNFLKSSQIATVRNLLITALDK